jgi:uncharacterized RDD family membrane protein YckC
MNLSLSTRYAGFWRRLAAVLIDLTILVPVLALLLYLIYGRAYFQWVGAHADPLALYGWGDAVVTNLLPVVLAVYFWMRYLGTPGKLLMGCHVVDARTGAALTLHQAIFRNLGYLVSLLTFGLGFLWIAWDAHKQGFHDKIAGSVVVRAKREGVEQETGTR